MTYDGELDIAIGLSARSKVWSNKKLKWSELVSRLGEENKTTETFKEFVSASKEDQLKIKDVGGYVGGYLRGGKRSPANVVHRQLMTLDLDFAHKDLWDDFTLQFDNAAVLHGTHKHSELGYFNKPCPLDLLESLFPLDCQECVAKPGFSQFFDERTFAGSLGSYEH
jgi:putative DNA primase/helicase